MGVGPPVHTGRPARLGAGLSYSLRGGSGRRPMSRSTIMSEPPDHGAQPKLSRRTYLDRHGVRHKFYLTPEILQYGHWTSFEDDDPPKETLIRVAWRLYVLWGEGDDVYKPISPRKAKAWLEARQSFARSKGRSWGPTGGSWGPNTIIPQDLLGDLPEDEDPPPTAELAEVVNLNQAAALVNRTPDGLRYYRGKGLPKPFIQGTKGQPNQYLWSEMRPWLESQFGRPIPEFAILKFRKSGR
jgi:hypothetical protein